MYLLLGCVIGRRVDPGAGGVSELNWHGSMICNEFLAFSEGDGSGGDRG